MPKSNKHSGKLRMLARRAFGGSEESKLSLSLDTKSGLRFRVAFSYLPRGRGICFIPGLFTHVLAPEQCTHMSEPALRRAILTNTAEAAS